MSFIPSAARNLRNNRINEFSRKQAAETKQTYKTYKPNNNNILEYTFTFYFLIGWFVGTCIVHLLYFITRNDNS